MQAPTGSAAWPRCDLTACGRSAPGQRGKLNEDWSRLKQALAKPKSGWERLLILPAWLVLAAGSSPGRQVIPALDPGSAFGTGKHDDNASALEGDGGDPNGGPAGWPTWAGGSGHPPPSGALGSVAPAPAPATPIPLAVRAQPPQFSPQCHQPRPRAPLRWALGRRLEGSLRC